MGFIIAIVKALHFFGLFMGGGSAFGMAVLGMTVPHAPPEHRDTLQGMAKKFKMISHVALGLLIATGIVMAIGSDAFGTAGAWFWIKLLGVVALVTGITLAGKAAARAFAGEPEQGARAEMFGKMNMVALVVILLAAVMAFG